MNRDVNPGRDAYGLALDLVRKDRVQYLPRGAGFRVVPTDGDPQPALDMTVLWELFLAGHIAPVRPVDVAGYDGPRQVRVTEHAPAPPGAGEQHDGRR